MRMAAYVQPLAKQPATGLAAWYALASHYKKVSKLHLRQLFADDPKRGERMVVEAAGLYLDYSKNRVNDETLRLLLQLAEEAGLRSRIDAMFSGEKINITEKRAVLHTALRAPKEATILVDGKNVVPEVHAVLDRMAEFSNRVRSGEWKGHTGKRIRNVINIGIGGSDLGPVMAYEALRHYSDRSMTFRFVSNVDGTDFAEAVQDLDPAETLFIVSSKTFTTLETMTNAQTARAWSLARPWRRLEISSQAFCRGFNQCGRSLKVRNRYGQHVWLLGLGGWPLLDGFSHRPFNNDCHWSGKFSRHAGWISPDG